MDASFQPRSLVLSGEGLLTHYNDKLTPGPLEHD